MTTTDSQPNRKLIVITDLSSPLASLYHQLQGAGYDVICVFTDLIGTELAQKVGNFDLVIIELKERGLEQVAKSRRAWLTHKLPLLFVTFDMSQKLAIEALHWSGVHTLAAPFSIERLSEQLYLLQRHGSTLASPQVSTQTTSQNHELHQQLDVFNRNLIPYTRIEQLLLKIFYEHRGQVLSLHEICLRIWHRSDSRTVLTLRGYIVRLRRKLLTCLPYSGTICTVRGKGYCLIDTATKSYQLASEKP